MSRNVFYLPPGQVEAKAIEDNPSISIAIMYCWLTNKSVKLWEVSWVAKVSGVNEFPKRTVYVLLGVAAV